MIDTVWQEKIVVHFSVRLKSDSVVWLLDISRPCAVRSFIVACFLTKPLESLLIENLSSHEFGSFTEESFS